VRFSWIVLWLGVAGPFVVLASQWLTDGRPGQIGVRHREVTWYAALPTLIWLGLVGLAALAASLDLPG
jgi:hypothetical protein